MARRRVGVPDGGRLSQTAGKRRQSATKAHARHRSAVNAAHSVHGAFSLMEMNGGRVDSLPWRRRQSIEYASPRKRSAAIAARGHAVMPIREALRREVLGAKGFPRIGVRKVKKTFTGKNRVAGYR